jgi:hypothetical protein
VKIGKGGKGKLGNKVRQIKEVQGGKQQRKNKGAYKTET